MNVKQFKTIIMKKVLFGLIATVMFGMATYAQSETEPKDPPLLEIVFGRVSKGCTGFGICRFRVHVTMQDVQTLATILVMFREGHVELQMSPEFFRDNTQAFQNGYLVIDEDFTLDADATKALGVDKYTIRTGKYKVDFDKSSCSYTCSL
jgi:hypothetical protein